MPEGAVAENLQAMQQYYPVLVGLVLGVLAVQILPLVLLWRLVVRPYLEWKRDGKGKK